MLSTYPIQSFARRSASVFAALALLSALPNYARAQTAPSTGSTTALPFRWDAKAQGTHITALASDASGRVFVGTEDNGLWMRDAAGRWQQFTAKNSGLADDSVYALAVDKQGRTWAGTLNNGVSVFNGKGWKNYGLLDGPVGERVFDLAVSPAGDVWMATSAGLSRYVPRTDTWASYTRANGLPSDQVQAIAFDKEGTLYAGTQCDGLVIADAKSGYAKWRRVVGPFSPGTEAQGAGLPSQMINDVLVARNGTVYVATTSGLGASGDKGKSWQFVRGADYGDKVKNRYVGPPNLRWQPKPGANLLEDYVTCLAEDALGRLYVGHRQQAYEVFDTKTNRRLFNGMDKALDPASAEPGEYVMALLPMQGSPALIGRYGSGLTQAPAALASAPAAQSPKPQAAKTIAFPSTAKPLDAKSLQGLLKTVQTFKVPMAVGQGTYLGDDWRTQGDWVGRYGRNYALLCAMRAPNDHEIASDFEYDAVGDIGPHRTKGESLRHWMHWQRADDNRKVLYNPILGYRREAEWDDRGEAWAMSNEGSGVYVRFQVPPGIHKVSLYFYNKDGEGGANRFRDYFVELKPDAPDVRKAEQQQTMAWTRVRDFRGGVYKSFIVRGPSRYWMKVGKNYSYNTILQAIFMDRLDEASRALPAGALKVPASSSAAQGRLPRPTDTGALSGAAGTEAAAMPRREANPLIAQRSLEPRTTSQRSMGARQQAQQQDSMERRGLGLWMGQVRYQAPDIYRLSPKRQETLLKRLSQTAASAPRPTSPPKNGAGSSAAQAANAEKSLYVLRQTWQQLERSAGSSGAISRQWPYRLQLLRALDAASKEQAREATRVFAASAKQAPVAGTTTKPRITQPEVAQALRTQALLDNWRWQMAVWSPEDRAEFDSVMKSAEESRKKLLATSAASTSQK